MQNSSITLLRTLQIKKVACPQTKVMFANLSIAFLEYIADTRRTTYIFMGIAILKQHTRSFYEPPSLKSVHPRKMELVRITIGFTIYNITAFSALIKEKYQFLQFLLLASSDAIFIL